ncbi:MAG: DUF4386 domain-containing protein [Williamsia sp.]|nr:DUF4386 domain-containing protein [Williamsia sp.]
MEANATTNAPSPQVYARLGGMLYLFIIIAGISSEFFFRGKLVVAGNAAATAGNIQASALLWRMGVAAEYASLICTIVLAMIYFFLLRPVHRNLNLLSTFFRLISITVQVVAVLQLGVALFYLDQSAASLKVFTPEQLNAMANLSIRSHSYGYGISLLFLGCCFPVHGYLIRKSGFLPKALGVLIQVAGLGYLVNGFALILAPFATKFIFPIFFLPVFIAETSLSLWLLVKGVHVDKWKTRYAQAG